MPIIHIEEFETSLLTLLGVSLVLWRRKADNALSNPLFYGPRPLTSQHLHLQFLIVSLLKFFVRSRRDWKEKMSGRIPTLPLLQSLRFRKPLHSCALLYCHAHPWERGGWGNLCWEGRGIDSMKWWWCGVGDEMISFLHSLYNGILESSRGTHTALYFAFALKTLLCSLHTLLWKLKQKVLAGLEKMET